ncbi:carboxypeptidase regulatory-like domain-containing protein [Hymenobacter algoricola]|uniref:Carboxypeptidase regulatory-like domain-containing protein n=1 Tax=Hymenobacter algoricola TaxID=486267 RepID=A0ABP7MQP4_9BACT
MKTSLLNRALAIFSFFLLLAGAAPVQAQTLRHGTLTGKLLDASTKEPIPNVTVVLLRASDKALIRTAITRADGTFEISRVPFGQYSFRTTVLGYRAQYPAVAFHAKQTTVAMGKVALQPLATQPAPVPTAPRVLLAAR